MRKWLFSLYALVTAQWIYKMQIKIAIWNYLAAFHVF